MPMRRAFLAASLLACCAAAHAAAPADAAAVAWWAWPLGLFVTCFALGIVAVPAGIGGGTLFVPIVGSLFPFHLDFVRGAGLLVALASALSAGPTLLRSGLGSLRLTLPLALLASASSIGGALLGLAMPVQAVEVLLGCTVLGIVTLMLVLKRSEFPVVEQPDALLVALGLHGFFVDGATGRLVHWQAHRTLAGLLTFVGIGLLAGLFGIGAGWANVPALNLLMGMPLKLAAGTSGVVLSLVDSSAAWVYLHKGAVLPMIAVLVASFFAYLTGLVPAHVPLEQLPQLWSLPVGQYLGHTQSPTGWGWAALLHRSDALGLAGIAILAACSVLALLAVLPMYAARRDKAFVGLCLAEALVVLLAASGLLTQGA